MNCHYCSRLLDDCDMDGSLNNSYKLCSSCAMDRNSVNTVIPEKNQNLINIFSNVNNAAGFSTSILQNSMKDLKLNISRQQTTPLSQKLKELVYQEDETCLNNIASCQEARDKIRAVTHANTELRERLLAVNRITNNDIIHILTGLVQRNERKCKFLELWNKDLMSQFSLVKAKEERIRSMRGEIESVNAFSDMTNLLIKAESLNGEVHTLFKHLEDTIQRHDTSRQDLEQNEEDVSMRVNDIHSVISVPEKGRRDIDPEELSEFGGCTFDQGTRACPRGKLTLDSAAAPPPPLPHRARKTSATNPLNVARKTSATNPLNVPVEISVDILRTFDSRAMSLVRSGRLYAVQILEGIERHAKISISEHGDVLLHSLCKNVPLPPGVHVVQFNELKNQIDYSSGQTFLELGESDSFTQFGTLYIRIHSTSLRAQQFIALCTGEEGPSYANTTLLSVGNKGQDKHEYVLGGDYEYNDGTGGSALFKGRLDDIEPAREFFSSSMAVVAGPPSSKDGQFIIRTRGTEMRHYKVSIGRVEKGLQDLQTVIRQNINISNVCVIDCGVVLYPSQTRQDGVECNLPSSLSVSCPSINQTLKRGSPRPPRKNQNIYNFC